MSLDASTSPHITQHPAVVAVNMQMNLDADSLWHKSREIIKSNLDPQIFAAWIKPLSIAALNMPDNHGVDPAEIKLLAPNKFSCEHVSRHYSELIASSVRNITGTKDVKVHFGIGGLNLQDSRDHRFAPSTDELGQAHDVPHVMPARKIFKGVTPHEQVKAKRNRPLTRSLCDANLNSKYNFSNFVVGNCNQFAHAASVHVSQGLGSNYNPLFIYGGVGLGKTHLVNAIGNAARRHGKAVLLVPSEYFVNELIGALRSNKMREFKNKFRSLDLLIIDDIQFIIGKERTQEEFFHTFNELYNKRRQVVLTSDQLPQHLTGLEERLRTRFASGLSADLQAPDFETRVAILTKKAEASGVTLPQEIGELLAGKIDSNVRELEGALNRVLAISSLQERPITLSLAEETLKSVLSDKKREVTCDLVQNAVAEACHVSVSDLLGKRRTQNIAFARHVAMYLCRHLTHRSYPEIGALFGGRDHSTVIHAMRVIEERIKHETDLRNKVEQLTRSISS